jgi:N-acetylneuraminic acid mutarotase
VGVWTGDSLLVWFGQDAAGYPRDGGRLMFDGEHRPVQWVAVPEGGLEGRIQSTAVWTGSRMMVWGGITGAEVSNNGGIYDPATGAWEMILPDERSASRTFHNAVWTGTELIVLNGVNANGALRSGAAYDPDSRTWRTLTTQGEPLARYLASVVWTGEELVVFGGFGDSEIPGNVQRLNPAPSWHLYRRQSTR